MATEYKVERARDIWDEIQPLLEEHWQEIAHFKDVPLEPKRAGYFALEERGMLRVFTVRVDRVLVGYLVYIVAPHLHYASMVVATQDVLFLLPEYRNAGTGGALIAFAEAALKFDEVDATTQHVKKAFDFGPLLAGMGYEPMDTIWIKRLNAPRGD